MATKGSRRFSDQPATESRNVVLNQHTLAGFILTGQFVDAREIVSSGQFTERPLNSFNSRTQAPRFEEMVQAHLQDGDISFALDLHTAVIAGRGFHIKAASENIKDYIMDFAKDFQLGEFGHVAVMESLGYGNSFYRYRDPANYSDIEWLPIGECRGVNWGRDGKVATYEFNAANYHDRAIPAEEILHLRWRRINASFFGFGLIAPLIQSRSYQVLRNKQWQTRERPAIMDIKPEMQDVGRKVLRRYIARHFIRMKDADDDEVKQARTDLKVLEPEEDIVTGSDATVEELGKGVKVIDWESWEKLFKNEIITMTQNPAIRIFTEPGFTKANSEAALDAVKMLLQGFADHLASEITNVIIRSWYEANPYYNANGQKVRWPDAKIEYCWGVLEKPKVELKDLIEIARLSATTPMRVIKPTEFRRNLRNMAGLDLDPDDDVIEQFPISEDEEKRLKIQTLKDISATARSLKGKPEEKMLVAENLRQSLETERLRQQALTEESKFLRESSNIVQNENGSSGLRIRGTVGKS